jgi:hypothetical protein
MWVGTDISQPEKNKGRNWKKAVTKKNQAVIESQQRTWNKTTRTV